MFFSPNHCFFSTKSTIRSLELPIHPISVVSSHLKSYPKKNGQANPGGDAAVQHDWPLYLQVYKMTSGTLGKTNALE